MTRLEQPAAHQAAGTYLRNRPLDIREMGRGYTDLDTGTHVSLLNAGNSVRTMTDRQGLQTACLLKIAFQRGSISHAELTNATD